MKHYTSIIHSVLIVLLILSVVCLYFTNQDLAHELNSRIVTTSNPEQEASEKFNNYSDNNMSILLAFIGVGFALFAFLTFQGVKDLFHSKINEMEDKQKETEAYYKKHVEELKDTKAIVAYNMADSVYSNLLELLRDKQNTSITEKRIIELSISAIGGFSEYLTVAKSESVKNNLKEAITKLIDYAYNALPKEGKIMLDNIDYEGFLSTQRKLTIVGDILAQQKLAFIFSKLDFSIN